MHIRTQKLHALFERVYLYYYYVVVILLLYRWRFISLYRLCWCAFLTWSGGRPEGLNQFLLGQVFFVLLAAVVLLRHHWVVEGSLTDGAEAVGVVIIGASSFAGLSIQLLHLSNGLRCGWDRNQEHTHL